VPGSGNHTGTPPLGHTAVKNVELTLYQTDSGPAPDAEEIAA
jgi:hypothetical protein